MFELGIDFEKFVENTNHHLAIGLASEIVFEREGRFEREYYLGPSISTYYHHFKLYFTTGILTDLRGENEWKSRVGVGHEFFFSKRNWLLVPSVALDFLDGKVNPALSLGFAREF